MRTRRRRVRGSPGDVLVGVLPLLAVAVLLINDHWWKGRGPDLLTGKVSDAVGLFVFPIMVLSVIEVVRKIGGRPWESGVSAAAIASLVTFVGFVLVKTVPPVSHTYAAIIGYLRWPAYAARNAMDGSEIPPPNPIEVTLDVTDLWMLVFVIFSFLYLVHRLTEPVQTPSPSRVEPL